MLSNAPACAAASLPAACMQLARGTEGTQAGPEDQAVAAAVGHAATTQLIQPGTPSAAIAAQQQAHLTEALARTSSISSSVLTASSASNSPLMPKLRTLRSSSESGQSRGVAQMLGGTAGPSRLGRSSAETAPWQHQHQHQHQHHHHQQQVSQHESTPLLSSVHVQDSKQWQHQGPKNGKDLAVLAEGSGGGSSVVAGLSDASAQVDNPDQRITADVSNYVQTSVGLVLLLVRKTLNCAAFAGKGWGNSKHALGWLLSRVTELPRSPARIAGHSQALITMHQFGSWHV